MIQRLAVPGGVPPISAAYSDDGRRLAIGGSDGTLSVWDPATGDALGGAHRAHGPDHDVSFNARANRALTASGDTTAKLWDLDANRLAEDLLGHRGWVSTAAFAPDERTVLTASQDGTARIWDAPAGSARARSSTPAPRRRARRFAADGKSVLTAAAARVQALGPRDRLAPTRSFP